MADSKIDDLPSAGALAGTEPLPIDQSGSTVKTTVQAVANLAPPETASTIGAIVNGASAATPNDTDLIATVEASVVKKLSWTNAKAFLKTYFDTLYAAIWGIVSGSITAANGKFYTNIASATYTDPTPVEGNGFIVLVRNGTATIGGTAYSLAGLLVYRFYHSGAWSNTLYLPNDGIVIPVEMGFTAGTNPSDNTIYYIGQFPSLGLTTSATVRQSQFPFDYTVIAANIEIIVSGTLGSAENSTLVLRIDNTTDTTISSTVKFNAVSNQQFVTGLNIDILSTNKFQLKLTTATWATNPTNPYGTITLFLKRKF